MELAQIKSLARIFYVYFFVLSIISCSEDSSSEGNSSPSTFDLSVDEVSSNSAKIIWTASTDPDGDTVFYDVFLDGSKVADNITDLFFQFNELEEDITYSVEVIASDPDGNETSVETIFSTEANQPPSLFSASIVSNNPFYPVIEWTESIDPEGTEITYNVYLDNQLIVENTYQSEHIFDPLRGLQTYIVKIEAVDATGKITAVAQQLTTTVKIYDGYLNLDNQDFVDSFGEGGYNEIDGNLIIGSLQNITNVNDLSALLSLTAVNGNLTIKNTDCQNLTGLDNIELSSNWPKLTIADNDSLINLEGLGSIQSAQDVLISFNDNLISLEGLDNLNAVTNDLVIIGNQSLNSLMGLSGLSFIGFDIDVSNNDSLVNLQGLESISSTPGRINICCNSGLISLQGLENFTNCGLMNVTENPNLSNLNHLSGLSSVYTLRIIENTSLTDLTGLENLIDVNHTISISRNDNLTSLNGIQNVIFTDNPANYHELIIKENVSLTNLDPLVNYYYDRGKVNISQNSSLTDLCGITYFVLNMTDFINDYNFTWGNAYNPGIVNFQNGNCSL